MNVIVPDWPAPSNVRAFVTTREGGVSERPYGATIDRGGGMNLGRGSGDARDAVEANRALLGSMLPAGPAWLRQVHGTRVVDAMAVVADDAEADASFTDRSDVVCAILVADCMPVLFCDRAGQRVAAAHAGWRGLVGGVLEATLSASGLDPAETMAWIGPAIGPTRFEVGADVRDPFIAIDDADRCAFVPHREGKWMADLPLLARRRLERSGVASITASGLCTASDPERFYSYRRDGVTGRMAALVWRDR